MITERNDETTATPGQRGRPKTRTAKRVAAQRVAAARAEQRRAAAQRRRRRMAVLGVLLGVLVVVGSVALTVWLTKGSDDKSSKASGAGSSATPTAAPTSTAFPPLPAGADAALKTRPTVGAGGGTLSKLTTKNLVEGAGPAVKSGQTLTVNYVGVSYQTGKEFDASWNRSQPFTFQVGSGQVIPGWDQGLVGAKVGSRIQLDIPSNLAYGDNPEGGRPAGPLRFVIDVLSAN